MKTCMMISGLCNKTCYKYINKIKDFCNRLNIDVFLVIDVLDKEDKHLREVLKPKSVIYVESYPDVCNTYNMFYKIKKGFELVTDYEVKHNTNYDVYIRCRYDINFTKIAKSFNFDNVKSNTLYIGERNYYTTNSLIAPIIAYVIGFEGFINDEFFFGDRDSMQKASYMFNHLEKSKICDYSAEEEFHKHLINANQLKVVTTPIYYTYTGNDNDVDWMLYQIKKYKNNIYSFVNQNVISKIIHFGLVIFLFYVIHTQRSYINKMVYGI